MPKKGEIKFNIEAGWLQNEYVTKRRRNQDLCDEIGCSMPTLLRMLVRFGIDARDDRLGAVHHSRRARFDLEEATRQYVREKANCYDIGDRMGVHACTVRRRLRESGIRIRHHNETKRGKPSHRRIDLDPSLVSAEYTKAGASIRSLNYMFGVSDDIIRRALKAAGVEVKKRDRTGAKNPNWRPHLTAEERALRRDSAKMAKWRMQVYERDGFKCQRCGDSRGGNLNAHHIEAHCENKAERDNPDNGITLCVGCHREFHSAYGTRGFGRVELGIFLSGHRVAA